MKEVPSRVRRTPTSISTVILILGHFPSAALPGPSRGIEQHAQNQYEEACQYLTDENYPKATEVAEALLVHLQQGGWD